MQFYIFFFLFCLGVILDAPGLIACYNWVMQGKIIIHRLNKLLTLLKSEIHLFTGQTVQNQPSIFCSLRSSAKILWTVSQLISVSFSVIWRIIQQSPEIDSWTVSIKLGVGTHCVCCLRFSWLCQNLVYYSKTHVWKTVLSS